MFKISGWLFITLVRKILSWNEMKIIKAEFDQTISQTFLWTWEYHLGFFETSHGIRDFPHGLSGSNINLIGISLVYDPSDRPNSVKPPDCKIPKRKTGHQEVSTNSFIKQRE